jgi:dTMP kinase
MGRLDAPVANHDKSAKEPMFFSFDGLDGVGKTTQIELFVEWLRARGHDVVRSCDPGSTPLGEAIRALLLGHEVRIDRTSEMLLFMAARAQMVEEVIRPALAAGKTVVSDRYLLANLVYQGHAGGLDVETIRAIGRVATGGVMPDLVFVLDMAPEHAADRIDRGRDRMESQGPDYDRRLREGFLAEAVRDPEHLVIVDAARAVDAVQADIRAAAARVLGAGRHSPQAGAERK